MVRPGGRGGVTDFSSSYAFKLGIEKISDCQVLFDRIFFKTPSNVHTQREV